MLPDGYKVAVLRAAQKGIVIAKNKFVENTLFIKNIAFFTRGVITDKFPSVRMVYPTDKIPFPWKKSPNLMAISPIPGKRTSLKLAWQIK